MTNTEVAEIGHEGDLPLFFISTLFFPQWSVAMQLALTRPIQEKLQLALQDPQFEMEDRTHAKELADMTLEDEAVGVSVDLLKQVCLFLSEHQPGL